jgi:hypothetical protein
MERKAKGKMTGQEQINASSCPRSGLEKQSSMKKVQMTPTKRRIKLQLRELSQRHGLMNNLLQNNQKLEKFKFKLP